MKRALLLLLMALALASLVAGDHARPPPLSPPPSPPLSPPPRPPLSPPPSPPSRPPPPPPSPPANLAASYTASFAFTFGLDYATLASSGWQLFWFKSDVKSAIADAADVDASAVTLTSVTSGSVMVQGTALFTSASAALSFASQASGQPSSIFSGSFVSTWGAVISGSGSVQGLAPPPAGSVQSLAPPPPASTSKSAVATGSTATSSGGFSTAAIGAAAGGTAGVVAVASAVFVVIRRRRAARRDALARHPSGRVNMEFLPMPPPPHRTAAGPSDTNASSSGGAGPSVSAVEQISLAVTGEGQTLVGEASGDLPVVPWQAIRHIIHARNVIGRGASGTVYRGELPGGRRVAVKRIPLDGDGPAAAAASSELQVIQRLHHPNLLRVRGFCIQGGAVYLLTDLATASLQQRLLGVTASAAPLSQRQRLGVLLGAARAVKYLHGLKPPVLHRDLKPDNILLDAACQPLVADFGIARTSPELKVHTHVASRHMGTLGYVAPEAQRLGQYSAKTDVFSLGVVMLQALTRKEAIVLPGDAGRTSRGDGSAEELREWLLRCMDGSATGGGGAPSAAAHPELFDASIHWDAPVLQGVLELALACTSDSPAARPDLPEIESTLDVLAGMCTDDGAAVSQEAHLCQICMEAPRDVITLPCRHAWACAACAERSLRISPHCVICRARVERVEGASGPLFATYIAPAPVRP